MIKKGTIIVFTNREGSPIRENLRGCKAELIRDFHPTSSIGIKVLEGELKGRTLYGEVDKKDFHIYPINKGK